MSIFNRFKNKFKSKERDFEEEIEEDYSKYEAPKEKEMFNIEVTDNKIGSAAKSKKDIIEIIEEMTSIQNNLMTNEYTTVEEIVNAIDKTKVEDITKYINDYSSLSEDIKERFRSEAKCIEALNSSVLSILYYLKEDGVDELLKLSVDGDKLSLKAMKLLCKHASEGIDEAKIVDSIFYIMEEFDESTTMEVLELLSSIKGNEKVEHVLRVYFKGYAQKGDCINSYNTILNLINNNNNYPKKYLRFLKSIALKDSYIRMNDILDNEYGVITFEEIDDELSIKAAITYYSIYKNDKEVTDLLYSIKENTRNQEIREYIEEILQ